VIGSLKHDLAFTAIKPLLFYVHEGAPESLEEKNHKISAIPSKPAAQMALCRYYMERVMANLKQ